jgi:integrase
MSAGHIRQRSPGAWEIRWPLPAGPDGKRRIGTKTIRGSKRGAQQALRAAMTAVDRGEHVELSKATVQQWLTERINQWRADRHISTRTAEHYDQLAKLVTAHLAIALQKLTTLHIERWHGQLRERGLSTRVIRHAHALLAQALDDAVKHNLLARNVAREQRVSKAERAEVQILAADQIAPLLAKLEGDLLYPAVIVALYCGLRRGEQLALRWSAIDLDRATMTISRALDETDAEGVTVKLPKTRAGRRSISLPNVVIDALRVHRREQLELRLALGLGRPPDDAPVFPRDDGGYLSPRAFSMRWQRTRRRLGLPTVHWHALRHTHASMLIAAGVDVVTVSKRLGHANPSITLGVYAHLFERDDAAAAAAINAALGHRG